MATAQCQRLADRLAQTHRAAFVPSPLATSFSSRRTESDSPGRLAYCAKVIDLRSVQALLDLVTLCDTTAASRAT
eukprot:COSAG02_NODE_5852_length_3988_cov_2.341219_2_plen_75_part_00